MMSLAAFLLAALLLSDASSAAESCPWVNAATVEGILGVPVTGTVTHIPGLKGKHARIQCSFLASDTALEVEVEFDSTPRAPFPTSAKCASPPVPLNALASEAFACAGKASGGLLTEELFGRVRDQLFTIELTDRDTRGSREKLRTEARKVTDYVTGNLF